MSSSTTSRERDTKWLRALIVVPVVLAITLPTFAWPSARLSPRDLPFGVAGPSRATQPVEQKLAQQSGAFEVHRYSNEGAARQAIEDRDIYGALVVSNSGTTLLTAPAASPTVAATLESAFAEPSPSQAAKNEPPAKVVEVVPADTDDPRGTAFGALVLPLVLSSVGMAVTIILSTRPGIRRAVVLVGASALGGVVATALMQSWLGVIGGEWIVNAGVLSLTMLSIAAALAGLESMFGWLGFGLGAAVMVLVGNAWSGISSAPEMLPKPLGLIGQLLPPGAGGNLLRSTAFFDSAGGASHLTVLALWAGLGLAGIWAGALVRRRRAGDSVHPLEQAVPAAGQTA